MCRSKRVSASRSKTVHSSHFEGQIDSIDDHTGKIKILVEIFGRPTEVELEHWQVEKI